MFDLIIPFFGINNVLMEQRKPPPRLRLDMQNGLDKDSSTKTLIRVAASCSQLIPHFPPFDDGKNQSLPPNRRVIARLVKRRAPETIAQ